MRARRILESSSSLRREIYLRGSFSAVLILKGYFAEPDKNIFFLPSTKAESEITDAKYRFSRASQLYVFKISVMIYMAISRGIDLLMVKKKSKTKTRPL